MGGIQRLDRPEYTDAKSSAHQEDQVVIPLHTKQMLFVSAYVRVCARAVSMSTAIMPAHCVRR